MPIGKPNFRFRFFAQAPPFASFTIRSTSRVADCRHTGALPKKRRVRPTHHIEWKSVRFSHPTSCACDEFFCEATSRRWIGAGASQNSSRFLLYPRNYACPYLRAVGGGGQENGDSAQFAHYSRSLRLPGPSVVLKNLSNVKRARSTIRAGKIR